MHVCQRIFSESLFCLKHRARNKAASQLQRHGCCRPECRACVCWLFTARDHSECSMPLLHLSVKYFECQPYPLHQEPLGTFRLLTHLSFLETKLLHLCGKFLDKKEAQFCPTFLSKLPRGVCVAVLWNLYEECIGNDLGILLATLSRAECLFGSIQKRSTI